METHKVYVFYKPCRAPSPPKFSGGWKGGPPEEISGVTYFEDEIGYYFTRGELVCDAS